jgi:biopolymer transport protein ExbD
MAGSVEGGEEFALNLYPMLDIFSILIVFLLMSFSTQGQSAEVERKLVLPDSWVSVNLDDAPSIIIDQEEIVIQGTASVRLVNKLIPAEELNQGALQIAYDEFVKLREVQETIEARGTANGKPMRDLSLAADKDTPFETIKPIMRAGGQVDFISYHCAAQKLNLE